MENTKVEHVFPYDRTRRISWERKYWRCGRNTFDLFLIYLHWREKKYDHHNQFRPDRRKRSVWRNVDVVNDDRPPKSGLHNKWDTAESFHMYFWRDDENRLMDQYEIYILRKFDEYDVMKDSDEDEDLSRHDSNVGTSRM